MYSSSFRGSSPFPNALDHDSSDEAPSVSGQAEASTIEFTSIEAYAADLVRRDPKVADDAHALHAAMEGKAEDVGNYIGLVCFRLLTTMGAEKTAVSQAAAEAIRAVASFEVKDSSKLEMQNLPSPLRAVVAAAKAMTGAQLAESKFPSEIDPGLVDAFEHSFYQMPYKGTAASALAAQISHLENKIIDPTSSVVWHSRSLAIIQSSGFGKSRLLREIGKQSVEDKNGQRGKVFSFTLCLRSGKGLHALGYPFGDADLFEFLNAPLLSTPDLDSLDDDLRATVLQSCLDARFAIFAETLWSLAGRWLSETLPGLKDLEEDEIHATWQSLADPTTPAAQKTRKDFMRQVVKGSEQCYTAFKDDIWSICSGGVKLEDAIFSVQQKTQERASLARKEQQAFRALLKTASWCVLSLDEAGNLGPLQLDALCTPESDPTAAAVQRATVAIASIRRLFAAPHGDRSWLLLADTNHAVAAFSPPSQQSPSARIVRKEAFLFAPFVTFPLAVGFCNDEEAKRKVLHTLSPVEASTRAILCRMSRPGWSIYKEKERNIDEMDEIEGHLGDLSMESSRDPLQPTSQLRCCLSSNFVLRKLLNPAIQQHRWVLSQESYVALFLQRVHVFSLRTTKSDSQPTFDVTKFLNNQVSYHLAMLTAVRCDSQEVQIAIPSEPIVSQLAAAFMRKGAKSYLGLREQREHLWPEVWKAFVAIVASGLPINKGYLGEICAQALITMAMDLAPRAPLDPATESRRSSNYKHGTASFVRGSDFLSTLFDVKGHQEWDALDTVLSKTWLNLTRLTARAKSETDAGIFTRSDLAEAWLRHEGLVLPANTAKWDLAVPLYAGNLTQPLDHNKLSFIAFQVKYRTSGGAACPTPPRVRLGSFAAGQESVTAPLGCEAVLVWLELGKRATSEPLKIAHERCQTEREIAAAPQPPAAHTNEYWRVQNASFDMNAFPVLRSIFGEERDAFPVLQEDPYKPAEGMAAEVTDLRSAIARDRLFA